MKKLFKSFLILSAIAMAIPCFAQTPNTLTKKEKKAGWELLFNGKDFSGWRQCNGTAMPANWVIEDNAMKVFTGEGKKPGQGANGDILYQNKKFKNFELSVKVRNRDKALMAISFTRTRNSKTSSSR